MLFDIQMQAEEAALSRYMVAFTFDPQARTDCKPAAASVNGPLTHNLRPTGKIIRGDAWIRNTATTWRKEVGRAVRSLRALACTPSSRHARRARECDLYPALADVRFPTLRAPQNIR
jgi:hypothetical protein